jgi:hypothetical protein
MLCPRPGDRAGMMPFENFADWRRFMLESTLPDAIPTVVRTKFERVQKQYVIARLDIDLMLAGGTVAPTTLELASKDRFGQEVQNERGEINSRRSDEYMVETDGLTDQNIPMVHKFSARIVVNLYETKACRAQSRTFGPAGIAS